MCSRATATACKEMSRQEHAEALMSCGTVLQGMSGEGMGVVRKSRERNEAEDEA